MAQIDNAKSFRGSYIRVTRLDAAGKLVNAADACFVSKSFIKVSFTPEYEEGEEHKQQNADGSYCLQLKLPDTLKRVNIELSVCDPAPELSEMLSGGKVLKKNLDLGGAGAKDYAIGWAFPDVGEIHDSGVAIEVWSQAVLTDTVAGTYPYWHWVFPKVNLRPSGSREFSTNVMANTFEGFGTGNVQFKTGPDTKWPFPENTTTPALYARVEESDLPKKLGLQAVPIV